MLLGISVLTFPFELTGMELVCAVEMGMEEDDCPEDKKENENNHSNEYVLSGANHSARLLTNAHGTSLYISAYNSPTLEVASRPPICVV